MKSFNNFSMKKIAVLFFVFTVFWTGCGNSSVSNLSEGNSLSESAAKEAGEQIAEEMLGGIDIEFAEEGSGEVVAWPDEMPSDVPVFEYGKIDATEASPTDAEGASVVVSFIEVEKGAYNEYEQDLENAGWTIVTDSSWTDEHISAEKDGRTIDVDVDPMGENTAFLYYMTY